MDKTSKKGKEKARFIPLFQTGESKPNPISKKKGQPLDGEQKRLANTISGKKSQPLDGEEKRLPNTISGKKSQPLDGEEKRLPNPISKKKSRPLDGEEKRLPNPISKKKSRPLDGEEKRLPNPIPTEKSRPLGKGREEDTAAGQEKAEETEHTQGDKMKKTREKSQIPAEEGIDEFEEVVARVLDDASPGLKEERQTTVQLRTPSYFKRKLHDEQKDKDEEYYEQYSSCSVSEEQGSGDDDDDNISTSLWPGCLVWAQQTGYPWWPAMVERDPDTHQYCCFTHRTDTNPSRYHVTYLGQPVSRAWLSSGRIKPYSSLTLERAINMPSQKRHMEKLKKAVAMASRVQKETVITRIDMFGFLGRFVSDRESSEDSDLEEAAYDILDSHNIRLEQTNKKTKDGSSKQRGSLKKMRRERESDGDVNKSCRTEEGTKRRKERKSGGLEEENSQ
ncbi:zinc finger CW-type PWWP domain protein 1-like isoform X2 [Gadus macrocephalus]|uniref:zinc finger CW-type PWWP domain protein 1-like isoform X2 n=1 Tax=Gadus macrocephalus TaxID=80720 RepID=UPI0028CB4653|nr:zinc finger CW-type PWWP domain protein 1-like isoform X2 [Gadus macrocephalus]